MKKPAEFEPLLERQRKRCLQDTGAVLWASAAFRTRGWPCGQALPWGRGIGSASAAFRTEGGRTLEPKRGRSEVKDGDGEEGNPPVSAVLRV